MKQPLIPNSDHGQLCFSTWSSMITVADLLMQEGYVVLLSREEAIYILNYVWSSNCSDRNDVVFMDRDTFYDRFYEEDEDEEWQRKYNAERAQKEAANSAWHLAQKLMRLSSNQIEEVFQIDPDDEKKKDRFWMMFPDQIPYDIARSEFDRWDRERMKGLEDEVLNTAMDAWERMSVEAAEEKMECDTTSLENVLNDTLARP